MGAAAAIILRKERDIVQVYRSVGATDSRSARHPSELGVDTRVPFKLLVKHAVLRDAGEGKYYLEEASWEALRYMRHRVLFVVVLLTLVLIFAGAFGAGVFGAHRTP